MKYINYLEREPDNTNLYDNGTPFDKPEMIYDNTIGQAIPYLKDKQPIVIVLIGGQSTGKTTLGTHLIDIFNYFYNIPYTNLEDLKNVQYSQKGTEFIHKLPQCAIKGYPVHLWDDSGKYSRKNSLTQLNKEMDEAMDIVRVYQTAIILVRHDIHKIPKELIEHEIIGIVIRCKKRKPGSGYVEAEVYDFEQVTHIISNLKTAIASQYIYNKLVYPNFHFRFKDLSPKRSAQLDKLSSSKKKDLWEQKDITAQGLLTIQQLAEGLDRSVVWTRQTIKELQIEPTLTSKKRFYYSPQDINKIKYQSQKTQRRN